MRLLAHRFYSVPADVAADSITREEPPFWLAHSPPVAQDFEELWGEHDIAIFGTLCVAKIYVAMAATRQSERTVAPVGGNITFAYESSERFQESDEPRIGMPGLGRDVIWQIAERECFRFHFQVDLRVNVRGVQGDMTEPGPDGIDVDAGAKQMDRTRMPPMPRSA